MHVFVNNKNYIMKTLDIGMLLRKISVQKWENMHGREWTATMEWNL